MITADTIIEITESIMDNGVIPKYLYIHPRRCEEIKREISKQTDVEQAFITNFSLRIFFGLEVIESCGIPHDQVYITEKRLEEMSNENPS